MLSECLMGRTIGLSLLVELLFLLGGMNPATASEPSEDSEESVSGEEESPESDPAKEGAEPAKGSEVETSNPIEEAVKSDQPDAPEETAVESKAAKGEAGQPVAEPATAEDPESSPDTTGDAGAPPLKPEDPGKKKKKSKVSVSVTDDLEIRYWRIPKRLDSFPDREVFNYLEQVNRITVNGSAGSFTAFAQIDQVALMFNRYQLDGVVYNERDLVQPSLNSFWPGFSYVSPEKFQLKWSKGATTLVFGDFYAAFGRGGALNLNRNVDIDIDTSIQGLRYEWKGARTEVSLLAGQLNRQQVFQDNPNQALAGDRRHSLIGGRAVLYGVGPMNFGVHSTVLDYVEEPGWKAGFEEWGTTPDVVTGGATIEAMGLAGLDWFVEADVFGFPTAVARGPDDQALGYGVYASSTAYWGATSWLFEAKRYKGSERINAPTSSELYEIGIFPTLEYERAINKDSNAAMNSNDIWGGRLQVDWAVSDTFVPYGALAVYRDDDLENHDNPVPESVVHALLGGEYIGAHSAVLFNAGLRVDERDGTEYGIDRQVHADVSYKFPIAGTWSASADVYAEHFHFGKGHDDYVEIESAVTVRPNGKWAVTWFTDYTTNPFVDSTGNLAEAWYGAAEVQWQPASAWTVKGFFGAYKAGLRCAGGQCRLLPGFNGARVSVTGTF